MRTERSQTRHAFTLVELLVVVAIIVILIAILMPSLERAVSEAQAAACGSNQKQIGTLMQYYLGDHNRSFPCYVDIRYFTDSNGDGAYDYYMRYTLMEWLRRYTTSTEEVATATFAQGKVNFPLMFCPNDSTQVYDNYQVSYSYNSLAFSIHYGDSRNYWIKASRVDMPQATIMFTDSDGDDFWDSVVGPADSGWGSGSPGYRVGDRHRGKSNVLMVDGHVERHEALLLNKQRLSSGDYWWDANENRAPGEYRTP